MNPHGCCYDVNMALNLSTKDFTLLIDAVKLTTYAKPDEDPTMAGLYLYTTEGESGEEVGFGTLLVGVGYDGNTAGQFAVPVQGQLPHPILLPAPHTAWVKAMCDKSESIARKTDKDADHTVELRVVGTSLQVTTLSDGFPAEYDTDARCPLIDPSQYPAREASARLAITGIVDGKVPTDPDALVKVLGSQSLKIMEKATRTLKTPIRAFPTTVNGGPVILTEGTRWRAVTSVEPYEGATDGAPDVEPIAVPEPKAAVEES